MESARTVLFVCLHGSGKSLIAAEYFRRLAAQRGLNVRAVSGGIDPHSEISPKVVREFLANGIDVRRQQPRPVTTEELSTAWRVVSFGCNLGNVAPAGLIIQRWDDVPAVSEDFNAARDAIVAHLPELLAECDGPSNSNGI